MFFTFLFSSWLAWGQRPTPCEPLFNQVMESKFSPASLHGNNLRLIATMKAQAANLIDVPLKPMEPKAEYSASEKIFRSVYLATDNQRVTVLFDHYSQLLAYRIDGGATRSLRCAKLAERISRAK